MCGRQIVATEVATYLAGQRMAEVTTVTALRQRAADVVEAELLRLDNRLPGLDPDRAPGRRQAAARAHRAGEATASAPGGDTYAEALRELFELDPHAVDVDRHCGRIAFVATEFDVDAGENYE